MCLMSEIKIYKITGYIRKPKINRNIPMTIEIKAVKIEDALEQAYSVLGSKHKAKRTEIFIAKEGGIVEILVEDTRYTLYKQVEEDNFEIIKD